MSTKNVAGGVSFHNLPPRVQLILSDVANDYLCTPAEIIGTDGVAAKARHEVIFRLRDLRLPDGRPPSDERIARWIGLSRSAVAHARVRSVRAR